MSSGPTRRLPNSSPSSTGIARSYSEPWRNEINLAERRQALQDSPVKASSICGGFESRNGSSRPQRPPGLFRHTETLYRYHRRTGGDRNDGLPDRSPWKTQHQVEIELLQHVLKEIDYDGYMAFGCGLSDQGEIALPRSVAHLKQCLDVA